jgi:hypothetical protein
VRALEVDRKRAEGAHRVDEEQAPESNHGADLEQGFGTPEVV